MPRPIVDTPVEKYRKVIEVNQIGMFTGIHTCAPLIAESCAGGPSGSIVLVSSVNGFVGAGGIAGYVSSKFAVRGLAKVAALELGRRNVRVNSVHPGPIDTTMIQPESWGGFDMRPILAKNSPLGRVGTPDDVAELVCFLASDASRVLHRIRVRRRRRLPRRPVRRPRRGQLTAPAGRRRSEPFGRSPSVGALQSEPRRIATSAAAAAARARGGLAKTWVGVPAAAHTMSWESRASSTKQRSGFEWPNGGTPPTA